MIFSEKSYKSIAQYFSAKIESEKRPLIELWISEDKEK